jgi:DNA-binding Xre family transcriptional regulator
MTGSKRSHIRPGVKMRGYGRAEKTPAHRTVLDAPKTERDAAVRFVGTVEKRVKKGVRDVMTSLGTRGYVIMAEDVYRRLTEIAEDRAAVAAYHQTRGEESVPVAVVDRLLGGENPIRVWREHRGKTLGQLSAEVGKAKGLLSDMENGKKTGSIETLRAIARALDVDLDDLLVREEN